MSPNLIRIIHLQIHVSYVKRETFGCIVQNMIECLLASPEDRDFYVTACKILSGMMITRIQGGWIG